jgi:NAD(P) transhydrogenase
MQFAGEYPATCSGLEEKKIEMSMSQNRFDLVVIGSGPAGERAAIQASKLGKRVAIVEKRSVVGGVCVHSGTLPSKTLRETAVYYDGLRKRSFYGINLSLREGVSIQELMHRKNIVVQNELEVIEENLNRNGITVFGGRGQFVDRHHIEVIAGERLIAKLETEIAIIAVGTRSRRLPGLDYDGGRVFDGESILELRRIPRDMIVMGGGVIGCEWASIFSKLGINVTLLDRRKRMLPFLDHGIADRLFAQMRNDGVKMVLGCQQREIREERDGVVVVMEDESELRAEVLLITAGRLGNTHDLGLKNIGLRPNEIGLLEVDHDYRTPVDNVFAVGDVIGFPSLASTSADQGRLAARAAFLGSDSCSLGTLLPFGIYTIPEVSYVGETEESLTAKNHPYAIGLAYYYELPRGQINNDHEGALKLLFDRDSLKLLGVHIIGSRATETVHLGQAVMAFGGTIEYFIDTVTNFPTMTEAYKIAALNGINRLGNQKR